MNEKQVKLLRYFRKHTGDHARANQIQSIFDLADHKTKGKITTWLKKVVVTMMAVKKAQDKRKELEKHIRADSNLKILEGFAQ